MTSPTRDNPFDGGSLHGQRVRFTEPDERFARSIDEDMKRRDILAEITGVLLIYSDNNKILVRFGIAHYACAIKPYACSAVLKGGAVIFLLVCQETSQGTSVPHAHSLRSTTDTQLKTGQLLI